MLQSIPVVVLLALVAGLAPATAIASANTTYQPLFRGPASQLVLRANDLGPTTQQSGTFGDPNTNFTEILLTPSNQPGFPDDVTSTVQVLPDAAAAQQTFAASYVAPPPGIQTRVLQSPNIGETSSAYQKVDNGYVQVYARVKNVILGAEAASPEDAVSRVVRIMADRTVASLSVANGWASGPNAQGGATIAGSVDVSTDADGGTLTVSGWAVDVLVADGPGIDDVRVYDGSQTDSAELARATIGVARPDVAATLNNQAWGTAGFGAQLDPTRLAVGQHTLVVAAHSPTRGWWSTTLTASVAATPTATATVLSTPTATDAPSLATDADSSQATDQSEDTSQPAADASSQALDSGTPTPMPTIEATSVPTSTPTPIATVPPTPQAAAIEGPYRGSLADIGFKADDFGAGWTIGAQSVDPPDDSKIGTVQTRFVGPGGVQVSTHVSVYRSRAAAQGAWIYANVSGGSLGTCDASWDPLGVAESDPTRGECLVQNVEAGASGASASVLQTILARLAGRVNEMSTTTVAATSTPVTTPGEVRFTGDPRSVALTEADFGGNWRLESDDATQLTNHLYSELFRKKDRTAAGMAVEVQVFDSAAAAEARLRQFSVAQSAPADAGLGDLCFEGVDPLAGPSSLQIACRSKNVTLFTGASGGADHAQLVQLMQSMVARVSAQAH